MSGPLPPSSLDPLFGRDEDLGRVEELLVEGRLVTLTGPGGSGKTRLAQAVASRLQTSSRSVHFVDVAGVRERELIASSITVALHLEGSEGQTPLQAVSDALAGRDIILVLDNLEQIPNAGTTVGELLDAAAAARVLATSRVPLGVRREVVYAVGPLDLPAGPSPDAVEASPAGALFLDRSRVLGGIGNLDDESAAAIARLLHRLDGLPLAIELAAARTRILSPREIDRWLAERGVAAVESREARPHRSLRAILAYTMDLLTDDQRQALRALSVSSGFDIELAQALAPAVDILDAVDSLAGLGLVRTVGASAGRSQFRILEPIRDQVVRALDDDELAEYRDRHAQAVSAIAADYELEFGRNIEPDTLIRLDADADNFRAALDWLEGRWLPGYLALWHDLRPFWESRLRHREGLARFERILVAQPEPTLGLSRAMSRYAGLRFSLDGRVASKDVNDRALRLAQAVGDKASEVEALTGIAMIAVTDDDLTAAQEASASAMRIAAALGDPAVTAMAAQAWVFAVQAIHGAASDEMRAALTDARDASAAAGWEELEMTMTGNLAVVELYRGDYATAVGTAERATAAARRRDHHLLGWCLSSLAIALAETGQIERAIAVVGEASRHASVLGVPDRTVDVLTAGAAVALAAGAPLLAARAYAVAIRMYDDGSAEEQPENRALLDGVLDRARKRSRPVELELALRDGTATAIEAILRLLSDELVPTSSGRTASVRFRHGELTRRELEVLALVGLGRSDPEIAEALFISPKTASVHVTNIKGKLGANSRLEVALRARELGLVTTGK